MNLSSRLNVGVRGSILLQRHSTEMSDGLAVTSAPANPRLGASSQLSIFLHKGDHSHAVPKPEPPKWPCPDSATRPCVEVPWEDTQMSIISCHCSAPQLPPQEILKQGTYKLAKCFRTQRSLWFIFPFSSGGLPASSKA